MRFGPSVERLAPNWLRRYLAAKRAVEAQVWDIYGDYYSYSSVLDHRKIAGTAWMDRLMMPFTIFFGIACIVSLVSIALKLKIFVGFAKRLFEHAAVRAELDGAVSDLKNAIIAKSLVGLLEDLPMGTISARPGAAAALLPVAAFYLYAGIFGAIFLHRSNAECLDKLPACNLRSGSALTLICSCLTSFFMLGLKLGDAFKTFTKLKEQNKYRALYQLVAGTYGDDEAQRFQLLVDSVVPPNVPGAQQVAGPPFESEPVQPVPHLLVHQILPPQISPQLADVAHAQVVVSEPIEVRGVCDGCGQNVLSSDEGRKREGSNYFHEQCVKGLCGGCGRIVHANSGRTRVSDVYWHIECA
jgi:hypothetical protein